MRTDLTAHQIVAVRRAFPGAQIDGDMIQVGIWHMQLADGQLTLPSARRPDDTHIDGSDEAMAIWTRLREVLGC